VSANSGEKTYKCEECDKAYSQSTYHDSPHVRQTAQTFTA